MGAKQHTPKANQASSLIGNAFKVFANKRLWLETMIVNMAMVEGNWEKYLSKYLEPWMVADSKNKILLDAIMAISEKGEIVDLVSVARQVMASANATVFNIHNPDNIAYQIAMRQESVNTGLTNTVYYFFLFYQDMLVAKLLGRLASILVWNSPRFKSDCEEIANSFIHAEGGTEDIMAIWETAMQHLLGDCKFYIDEVQALAYFDELWEFYSTRIRKWRELPQDFKLSDTDIEVRRRADERRVYIQSISIKS